MKSLSVFTSAAAFAAVSVSGASAAIVGGAVTGGQAYSQGGAFVELSAPILESNPDNTVGNNTFQNPNFYAFTEGSFTVGADLSLNFGAKDFGELKEGQVVESHYIMYDPKKLTTMEGYVDFDGPIVGIATSFNALSATDIFGNPAITYLAPNLRGLENRDKIAIEGLSRLVVDWRAGSPGDFIRVFTVKEVPLPAAAWVFLAGLGGLAARARARKKAA